jgi:hypothetical protein
MGQGRGVETERGAAALMPGLVQLAEVIGESSWLPGGPLPICLTSMAAWRW